MDYYWYFILFVFGLAVGSFLNVVVLRYRPDQKLLDKRVIGGRSHCLACRKKLAWYELIPVISFLVQLGKCRHCGHRLSLQYPLVELLSGLIFVFVPLSLVISHWSLVIVWVLIFLLFLLLSIIDLRHSIIPNSINSSLAILGIVLIVIKSLSQWSLSQESFIRHYSLLFNFGFLKNDLLNNDLLTIILNHLFAALLGMAIFGLIIFLSRGRAMGLGDLKLVGALGLIFGWPDTLMVMFLAFIVGSLISVFFLITGKKKIKDAVPFGPFLVIGASLTFFFGYQIINGYLRLFGL